MFTNLMASAPQRRLGSTPPALGLATTLHIAIVLTLVWQTSKPAEQRAAPRAEQFTFLSIPEAPAPVEPPEPPPAAADEQPAAPEAAPDVPAGYQVLAAPAEITGIPEPGKVEFRAEDFTGRGIAGGLGGGRKVLVAAPPDSAPELETPLSVAVVDQPPRLKNLAEITPRLEALYPRSYHMAGIEGRVIIEVVVDRDGRVEDDTMKVVSSSHADFEEPSRDLVRLMRFEPARRNGRAVRVWIRLPINWTIGRS